MGEEGQQEMEEEDNFNTENYCDFTVFIRDNEGKRGLVVDATSMDTEINFNNVFMSEDVQAEKQKNRFERQLKGYAGPDFSTLDERIQTGLTEYLEGYGVNEHLSAFVECMSLDKDQRLYMAWLSNLKEFTNKQWETAEPPLKACRQKWQIDYKKKWIMIVYCKEEWL